MISSIKSILIKIMYQKRKFIPTIIISSKKYLKNRIILLKLYITQNI